MFGWLKKDEGKKPATPPNIFGVKPKLSQQPPQSGSSLFPQKDDTGADDIFGGMKVSTDGDLFGGMNVNDPIQRAPSNDFTFDTKPAGIGSFSKPSFSAKPPEEAHIPKQEVPVHIVESDIHPIQHQPEHTFHQPPPPPSQPTFQQPPPPIQHKPVVEASRPVPKPQPPIDIVVAFHTSFDDAIKRLLEQFNIEVHKENDIKSKLSSLEETKMKINENISKAEEEQGNALAVEDYEKAEKLSKQIDQLKTQLSNLNVQKDRGLGQLVETNKSVSSKLVNCDRVISKCFETLEGIVNEKTTKAQQVRNEYEKKHDTLQSQYSKQREECQNHEQEYDRQFNENKRELDEIDAKIESECYETCSLLKSKVQERDEIDDEIKQLEEKLKKLNQDKAAVNKIISECESKVNIVKKNYAKDLGRLGVVTKKLEEQKQNITNKQKAYEKIEEQLDHSRREMEEVEGKHKSELDMLNEEFEMLKSQLDHLKNIGNIHKDIVSLNSGDLVSKYKEDLENKKKLISKINAEYSSVETNIDKQKTEMNKLKDQIPEWEDNKKKAVEGKNFAIAGKMSNQIKVATSQIEQYETKLKELESSLLEHTTKLSDYNNEINDIQSKIDSAESDRDNSMINFLEKILEGTSNALSLFDIYPNIHHDLFHTPFKNLFESFHEVFKNEYTKKGGDCNKIVIVKATRPGELEIIEEDLTDERKAELAEKLSKLREQLDIEMANEDFDKCDQIQKQIDHIASRIEM